MSAERDFLEDAPTVIGGSQARLMQLMSLQNDYLQEIAIHLRRQNSDVLTTTLVKGTSQLTNALTDTKSHEINFLLGGKPVEIYRLLIFSTYTQSITFSPLSLANVKDGIVLTATSAPLSLLLPTHSLWVQATSLAGGTCSVNGPADSTNGGLFIYGFTIPDFERIRSAVRD